MFARGDIWNEKTDFNSFFFGKDKTEHRKNFENV
jgi:hypothetical protein